MKTFGTLTLLLTITVAALFIKFGHPSNPVDMVRNGYMSFNKTTTVGQAINHTFSNGEWKAFKNDKGITIVEFDGSRPFFTGNLDGGIDPNCDISLICNALLTKISKDCDLQSTGTSTPSKYSCFRNAVAHNANDPIPITIQFTLNPDGTFQYLANDFYSNPEALFYTIYN